MHRLHILAIATAAAPMQLAAQTSPPGADASSTLGRDAAVPSSRDPVAAPASVPVITVPDAADVQVEQSGEVQIGAVFVEGLSRLSQADFADIAESYSGRTVGTAGLRELARAIADRARQRGYIFASALVPPQQLNVGIIRVTLDEGAIDEVRISGSGNPQLAVLLNALVGPAVRTRQAERQLLLASDIPGISLVSTRFVRDGGKGVLVVEVSDQPTRAVVTIDNYGPRAFGPVRARFEFELNGLLDADDQLATYVTLTPAQPRELTYIAARYANTISASGIQLAVLGSAGRTRDANRAAGYEAIGRSRGVAGSLSAPLIRSNRASLWASAELSYLEVDQLYSGFGAQHDDIATAVVSGWGNVRVAGSRLYGGLSVTRGLEAFGATEAGDPQASRPDGSGKFTKANAWFNWTGKLVGSMSMRLVANGQLASRPLLAPQEIGLGGPNFGRGYDFSERFGDQGVLGLAELRRTFERPAGWLDWAQFYGFVDGGYVDNLRGGFGGGTLVSGGGGIRAGKGRAEIGVEVAAPINADRFESGDRSPKLNLVVSYGF